MSPPELPRVPEEPLKKSRRRFLGTGTAVTPALLTLASQPALGVTCFTPSRNLSKNTSVSQQGKNGDCTGTTVTSYAGGTSGSTTAFHSLTLFAGDFFYVKSNPGNTNGLRSLSLNEVLKLSATATPAAPSGMYWCSSTGVNRTAPVAAPATSVADTITLAKHIAAAYLNCMALKVPPNVLKATGAHPSCTDIWSDFIADGSYQVMAGVTWTATQIVDYLKTNNIAPA